MNWPPSLYNKTTSSTSEHYLQGYAISRLYAFMSAFKDTTGYDTVRQGTTLWVETKRGYPCIYWENRDIR